MWPAMTRKPGQPAAYLRTVYSDLLAEHQSLGGSVDKFPETLSERVWEAFIKRLLQKDYKFDAGFYGALNEFSKKVAYFFHASLQATAVYPGTAGALRHVSASGLSQGLIADTQFFTLLQLQRGLTQQDSSAKLDDLVPGKFQILSHAIGVCKPSLQLFRQAVAVFAQEGISADQVLHIGSRITHDVVPARRVGMKTGLFAGDKASLQASPELLKDPASRPDVLLVQLDQIAEIVPE